MQQSPLNARTLLAVPLLGASLIAQDDSRLPERMRQQITELIEALGDDATAVDASSRLIAMGGVAVPALVRSLPEGGDYGQDHSRRMNTLYVLGRQGKQALPALDGILEVIEKPFRERRVGRLAESKQSRVQQQACWALGQIGPFAEAEAIATASKRAANVDVLNFLVYWERQVALERMKLGAAPSPDSVRRFLDGSLPQAVAAVATINHGLCPGFRDLAPLERAFQRSRDDRDGSRRYGTLPDDLMFESAVALSTRLTEGEVWLSAHEVLLRYHDPDRRRSSAMLLSDHGQDLSSDVQARVLAALLATEWRVQALAMTRVGTWGPRAKGAAPILAWVAGRGDEAARNSARGALDALLGRDSEERRVASALETLMTPSLAERQSLQLDQDGPRTLAKMFLTPFGRQWPADLLAASAEPLLQARHDSQAVLDRLLEALPTLSRSHKAAIIRAVGGTPTDAVAKGAVRQSLLQLVEGDDVERPELGRAFGEALARLEIGPDSTEARLLEHLDDPSPCHRLQAVLILGTRPSAATVQVLDGLRRAIADVHPDRYTIPDTGMVVGVGDMSETLHLAAARALLVRGDGGTGTTDGARYLVKWGEDDDRVKALAALGGSRDFAGAIDILVRHIDDYDEKVQLAAIRNLGKLGSPARETRADLEDVLDETESEVVRNAVRAALRRIR